MDFDRYSPAGGACRHGMVEQDEDQLFASIQNRSITLLSYGFA